MIVWARTLTQAGTQVAVAPPKRSFGPARLHARNPSRSRREGDRLGPYGNTPGTQVAIAGRDTPANDFLGPQKQTAPETQVVVARRDTSANDRLGP